MARRRLEVTVVSERDLNDVRKLFKMKVYAMVGLASSDQHHFQKTHIDREGMTDPTWNVTMTFTVEDDPDLNQDKLIFKLFCKRKLGDRYIGEVSMPVQDLLRTASDTGGTLTQQITRPVRLESGGTQGVLTFSYRFHEKFVGEELGVQTPQLPGQEQQQQSPPPRSTLGQFLVSTAQLVVTSVATEAIIESIMQ
ncbi:PREDICTED: protein SRC2 homolog [Nelumbo nucifera]|uniref:Protein SRC2 homolog n=2 Tax=Nelumbo nucifera TaxID=4432 RepID=A0A1U8B220_NELNU|nr:PREDICTED: protein SRC2 homolog [Nelumbo nucifera]DAD33362.1 TPA_asm: hypothetical protein HUJ06_012213 [Nelumbo nucifera]